MAKTKKLCSMYDNHEGYMVCTWYNSLDGCYEHHRFLGYSKKEVFRRLRANGVSVGREFTERSK